MSDPKKLFRQFTLDRAALSEESRTIELAFASETPVERRDWRSGELYDEILDCGDGCDLTRLNDGHPLLLNHCTDDQIGVVESATRGADKKMRAVVRFSKSKLGEEIWQDVKDGIRRLVSVGYTQTRELSRTTENGRDAVRFAWLPYEVSIVPIPADASVGVGRSDEPAAPASPAQPTTPAIQIKSMDTNTAPAPAPAAPANPAPVLPTRDLTKDHKEMFAIAKRLNKMDEYERAIDGGVSLEDFRAQVLAGITPAPVSTSRTIETPASLGDAFVNSDAYRNAIKFKNHRAISLEVPLDFRATGTTSGLTSIQKLPGVVLLEQQPLRIGDIIPQTVTDSVTIRYISESSYTNAATAVAEEGQKPEASWNLAETDATVRKIAVIGRVTDEMFADFAQMRDYVNNRLRFMVGSLEDNHLLNGTGNSNQIKGLLNFSGIQTQATAGDTVPDAIFKAITKVRAVGFFEPDAIVLHPTDWQNIKLMKDSMARYLGVGPFDTGMIPTLWGLPVVATTAIAQGTALVGAFRLGAQIFRKLGLVVDTTNSDASDFQYNRICIRAETRLALACYRPLAFCSVTGIA